MPRIIDIYEGVLNGTGFTQFTNPWDGPNLRNSAPQTSFGFPQPYVLRGTQRPGKPEGQLWLGPLDRTQADIERLGKMFVSAPGIRFISNQKYLNKFAIRPESNFVGAMINGPFMEWGSHIPRNARTSISIRDITPQNIGQLRLEPAFNYERDVPDGNLKRLYLEHTSPDKGFTVPVLGLTGLDPIGTAVNTSNTVQHKIFDELRNKGGLSGSHFSLGYNKYSDDNPYTGSANVRLPNDPRYQQVYELADAAHSNSFIDFRDAYSEAPTLNQAEDDVIRDFNGNLTPFDKSPDQYTYKDYNVYSYYGYRRPRLNKGRNFQASPEGDITSMQSLKSNQTPTKPDLIDVHFRRSGSGEVLYFECTLTNLSDGVNYNWSQENYTGRIDPVHYFTGVGSRKIQFQLKIVPYSREEMQSVWNRINALLRFGAPHINSNGQHRGTFLELTIGDYLKDRRGYITDISITPTEDVYWESNIGNQFDMYQLPRMIELAIGYEIVDNDPTTDKKYFFGTSGQDQERPASILWLEWKDYPND